MLQTEIVRVPARGSTTVLLKLQEVSYVTLRLEKQNSRKRRNIIAMAILSCISFALKCPS